MDDFGLLFSRAPWPNRQADSTVVDFDGRLFILFNYGHQVAATP
jgi:hypothetical protein